MKKQTTKRQRGLKLKKMTISKLNHSSLSKVKGGNNVDDGNNTDNTHRISRDCGGHM